MVMRNYNKIVSNEQVGNLNQLEFPDGETSTVRNDPTKILGRGIDNRFTKAYNLRTKKIIFSGVSPSGKRYYEISGNKWVETRPDGKEHKDEWSQKSIIPNSYPVIPHLKVREDFDMYNNQLNLGLTDIEERYSHNGVNYYLYANLGEQITIQKAGNAHDSDKEDTVQIGVSVTNSYKNNFASRISLFIKRLICTNGDLFTRTELAGKNRRSVRVGEDITKSFKQNLQSILRFGNQAVAHYNLMKRKQNSIKK